MGKCWIAFIVTLALLGSDCFAEVDSYGRTVPKVCSSSGQRFMKHVVHLAGLLEDENSADCVEGEDREKLETKALNEPDRQTIDLGDFIEIRRNNKSSNYYFFSKPTSPAYPWAIKFSLIPMGEPQGIVSNWSIGLPLGVNIPDNASAINAAARWLSRVSDIPTYCGYKNFFNIDTKGPSYRAWADAVPVVSASEYAKMMQKPVC